MSLKAKLEAVIYAAEEPVTLAQFAMLFADEAFAWKAERDAAVAPTLEFAEPIELNEAAEPVLLEEALAEPAAESVAIATPEVPGTSTNPEDSANFAEEASSEAPPAGATVDPELEAKRLARSRDREVREILRTLLDELIAEYAQDSRGIEIREIAGGFRMGTKPEIHDAVRAFVKSLKPPMKLSLPALETLAVIAYKQPVTAPEVSEIRGVDSAGVLGSLMSRKLISTAGRKQVIGRPMLYKTTKEFLLRFGLKDLNELPSMEEFEKMAALELNEESLDGESVEQLELSGNLFEGNEDSNLPPDQDDIATAHSADLQSVEPEAAALASNETVPETSIPTAETSNQAAEAHALVERLNAEEIEAEV